MSERYIVIPNWDRHQHYKDQTRPPWIKLHVSLLHDDDWLNLTPGQRSALVSIWMLYASTHRRVTFDSRSLSRQIGQRVTKQTLEALREAGFIEVLSRDALEQLYARSRSRSREETSTKDQRRRTAQTAESENGRSQRQPTEAEIVAERERRERSGYVENLSSYTGCKIIRGEVGISHVYDPLGTEYPPEAWPYQRPTKSEVMAALKERVHA